MTRDDSGEPETARLKMTAGLAIILRNPRRKTRPPRQGGSFRRGALMAAATTVLSASALLAGGGIASAAESPTVQGDCGRVTCTIRFDRDATRDIRDGFAIGAGAAGTCAAIPNVPIPPLIRGICGSVALPLAVDQVIAGRIYENGNCLGLRYVKKFGPDQPPIVWPVSVKGGTRNCN
jgi:hypothetical protein